MTYSEIIVMRNPRSAGSGGLPTTSWQICAALINPPLITSYAELPKTLVFKRSVILPLDLT